MSSLSRTYRRSPGWSGQVVPAHPSVTKASGGPEAMAYRKRQHWELYHARCLRNRRKAARRLAAKGARRQRRVNRLRAA